MLTLACAAAGIDPIAAPGRGSSPSSGVGADTIRLFGPDVGRDVHVLEHAGFDRAAVPGRREEAQRSRLRGRRRRSDGAVVGRAAASRKETGGSRARGGRRRCRRGTTPCEIAAMIVFVNLVRELRSALVDGASR